MPSSRGDLPNPGIEPRSPTLQADSLPSEPSGKPIYKNRKKSLADGYSYHSYMDLLKMSTEVGNLHGKACYCR